MKVQVNGIVNKVVHCSTYFGNLKVEWNGEKPLINSVYDIELNIGSTLYWQKNITLSQTDNFSIKCEGNLISLCGILESVDDDGYTVLRMGESIIPFMAAGTAFDIGSRIKVHVDSISVYPVEY